MTSASIKIEGLSLLVKELQQMEGAGEQAVMEVITDLTLDTQAEAVKGISSGPASGRVYQKYNPRRTHKASAPGQYPMSDTGRLANSVHVQLPTTGSLHGVVGTGLEYGLHLEFGTSKMAARPWLLRSFEKAKRGLEQELKRKFEAKT